MNKNKVIKKKSEDTKQASTVVATRRHKKASVHVWLNIQPEDIWLRVRSGDNVRKALRTADVELEGDCGGLGKCGKCKIKVLSLVDEPTEDEREPSWSIFRCSLPVMQSVADTYLNRS